MSKKNMLSGRDKELQDLANQYEEAKLSGTPIYMDAYDLADLSDWYAMQQRFDDAEEVIETGLKLHPDNTTLLIEKTYLYIDTNRKEEAYAIAESIEDNYSDEVKILRAGILLKKAKLKEAEELLDTITEKDDLYNLTDICYIYLDAGLPQYAMKWLEYHRSLHENEESFLSVAADCYYSQGDYKEAATYFNKLIDKNPYSPIFWMGLAKCYYGLQEYDKVIEACDFALISDEEYAEAYTFKGYAYNELYNYEAALENFEQALKRKLVTESFFHTFKAMYFMENHQWENSYKEFQAAIDIQQSKNEMDTLGVAMLYSNAARCLHNMDEKGKAKEYCLKALEENPDDLAGLLLMGRICAEETDIERSGKYWSHALQIAPEADTWYDIGNEGMAVGMVQLAINAYEQAKKLMPDYEGINECLAVANLLNGDKEKFEMYNKLSDKPFTSVEIEHIINTINSQDPEKMEAIARLLFGRLSNN